MSKQIPGTKFTPEQLLQRALKNCPWKMDQMNWVSFSNLLRIDEPTSRKICEHYGFDPDAIKK